MDALLATYLLWVKTNPLLSAAIQFGVLGTVGEYVSVFIRRRRISSPYNLLQFVLVVAGWALLGVVIKYGFVGMRGFVKALLEHGMFPSVCAEGWGNAFAVSVCTNLLFGPQMMFFHRIEENIIMWRKDYSGLNKAFATLLWFWIPAHTITFALPPELQVGLAACWSVVLGLILGLSAPKKR